MRRAAKWISHEARESRSGRFEYLHGRNHQSIKERDTDATRLNITSSLFTPNRLSSSSKTTMGFIANNFPARSEAGVSHSSPLRRGSRGGGVKMI